MSRREEWVLRAVRWAGFVVADAVFAAAAGMIDAVRDQRRARRKGRRSKPKRHP